MAGAEVRRQWVIALFNDNKFIVTYPKVDTGFTEFETYIIWESL